MLKRKVRWVGDSLIISIPSQLAKLKNIKAGDYIIFGLDGDDIICKKEI